MAKTVQAEYAAQRKALYAALKEANLPEADRASDLAIDAIAIKPRKAKAADKKIGASRLGGVPDLCAGHGWPEGDDYGWEFVCQIDLAQIAALDIHGRLPKSGLLSFFAGWPIDPNVDHVGKTHVVLHPAGAELAPVKGSGKPPKLVGVDFEPQVLLPPYDSCLLNDETYEYVEAYNERYLETQAKLHGMLSSERPMEQALSPGEVVLLRLDNDGALPVTMYASVVFLFIIAEEALRDGDFKQVRFHEGPTL